MLSNLYIFAYGNEYIRNLNANVKIVLLSLDQRYSKCYLNCVTFLKYSRSHLYFVKSVCEEEPRTPPKTYSNFFFFNEKFS